MEYLQDALFAAIAAIGFSAISRPPKRAFFYCAVIAAAGHSLRLFLMQACGWHIVAASAAAALVIGLFAVLVSPLTKIQAETYLYPALLPMIPGIYAYRTFGALVMCLCNQGEDSFIHYMYLFAYNGMTCFFIILAMVVGATIPMFGLPGISFSATRPAREGQKSANNH